MKKKTFTGFTAETKDRLLLDTGVFFKNYDVKTDTFETAVTAKKLLGATRGGGTFVAKPEVRYLEVDGLKAKTKGTAVIDDYEVSISTSIVEVTEDVLKMALVAVDMDAETDQKYTVIKPRENIEDEDYIDNVTWVGTLSGSSTPVIIQIFNVLNQDGLTLKTEKKGEAVIAVNLVGHYDIADLDTPPYKIYYPKKQV